MFRAAVLTLLILTATAALGDELPRYDVEATCRAAPNLGLGARRTHQDCVRDEIRARAQLALQWTSFREQRRQECIQESNVGGSPS